MRNSLALAEKDICVTGPRVGRKMRYPEKREAAFEAGTLARIEQVLRNGEDRTDFIREAVENELAKRGRR